MRKICAIVCVAVAVKLFAAPALKNQVESFCEGRFRARLLTASEDLPAPTPEGMFVVVRDTGDSYRVFRPEDIWKRRAFIAAWRDRRGNRLVLSEVRSLMPQMEKEYAKEDEIEKALSKMEAEFVPQRDGKAWLAAWKCEGEYRIFCKQGKYYLVELILQEDVKPDVAKSILKGFEMSFSNLSIASPTSDKWWEEKNGEYRFITDLSKTSGQQFIKTTMKQLGLMRKAYQFYVPPKRKVGTATVRVFRTLSGYREYRKISGDDGDKSCGLWDPMRDELLISAEDKDAAIAIMRHEGFHQYLRYATRLTNHAMWFNEGHATFFENIKMNLQLGTVQVLDEGFFAEYTDRNLKKVAQNLQTVLSLDYAMFYDDEKMTLNYVTAWALVYFLEKGIYAHDTFAPYRTIIPSYLASIESGKGALEATVSAFSSVSNRNLTEDFLLFWKEYRKSAQKLRNVK